MSQTTKIESVLKEQRVFYPPQAGRDEAYIATMHEYREIYRYSLEDPDGFWSERAKELVSWFRLWDRTCHWDFEKPEIRFFEGGKLNACYNCLDRHLTGETKNKAAIIWQGEPDEDVRVYTYQMLHREVCRFANVLKKLGIKKGDRVAIYLPMIPELPVVMLACARIGAIHSVVFGGFSSESLKTRIQDCEARLLITADGCWRAGRKIELKKNADEALKDCPTVEKCIVVKRLGLDINWEPERDIWYHEAIWAEDIKDWCECEEMDAEDILFILYTSGSTGKPKGVFHTTGGYLVYTAHTLQWVFDLKAEDIFWCTADIGWITGHSYIVYGPLTLGATEIMYESVPTYPHPGRFWELCERYAVTLFYTAPTVIRALMREGDEWPHKYDLSSLRILGTVGEPINPEAWLWYYTHVGQGRCPIVDTWWQTETGGFLISPIPYAMPLKPGSATLALPGVEPVILKDDGTPAGVNEGGHLCMARAWPGMLRGVWGDPERFKQIYFSRFKGYYYTGDGARQDEDGYFWIMGRLDDVINVSGHRLGTMELESALVAHPAVAEAAVIGVPHEVKGETIYAFVILKEGYEPSDELRKELVKHVRTVIGPIATPEYLQFVSGLPKTRSGKIMRRILRKIATGQYEDLGDTSTLADPAVVDELIKGRKELLKSK
ncbi:acetate--CoA ligase [Thermosulfuriphilus ammonigenes]|uniref:Acetyl-coenzyme A synthetase n=1 Tax=Thermosulfuriphilus ammonigenes TaxID=1936021 RepID=A0A6G7PUW6_9BACT|nr:acetate--CoA ligase [Thermosulfuriphilus ammonigenes]MBA2848639.1 acetyl-CoA synthetase [Thermosulfuriphilus ammonigenes]QIJ71223.1 acetate--CoA ligase [Thermosulfuriphilus ammonigenes]